MSETKLSERQQNILDVIKRTTTNSDKKMSEMLLVSQCIVNRDIFLLKKMEMLMHEGNYNSGMNVINIVI